MSNMWMHNLNYRQFRYPQIGFEIPIISSAVRSAADIVTSIFDRVPGSEWIKEGANQGWTFLSDMARDEKGRFLLQAITVTYLYGPLAGVPLPGAVGQIVVGPIVASLVWALPGMIAGESFTESYTKELTEKIQGVVSYFGGKAAGDLFANQLKQLISNQEFQNVLSQVKVRFGNVAGDALKRSLQELHLTPQELGEKFNVPDVIAASGINHYFRENIYDINTDFDQDGRQTRGTIRPQRPADIYRPDAPIQQIPVAEQLNKRTLSNALAGGAEGSGQPITEKQSILKQILIVAVLTAPAWFTIFVLPNLPKRKRAK